MQNREEKEEEEPEKQMGETDPTKDELLDEKMWGDEARLAFTCDSNATILVLLKISDFLNVAKDEEKKREEKPGKESNVKGKPDREKEISAKEDDAEEPAGTSAGSHRACLVRANHSL
jgi:hypothetical protein